MNVDNLSPVSRNFYEHARLKTVESLALGGIGMMLLGFAAFIGGESAAYSTRGTVGGGTSYSDTTDGSAFAAFAFVLAGSFSIGLSIYVSPVLCGSANEKRILKIPQEIDTNIPQPSRQYENGNAGGNSNFGTSNNAVSGHDYNNQAGGFNTMNRRNDRPGADEPVIPVHAIAVGVEVVDSHHDEWPKADGGRVQPADVVGVDVTVDR